MTTTEPLMIDCGPHGQRVATVACRHLLRRWPAPAGFIENSSDPNDLQAWCYLCEEKFQLEGDLTDAFQDFSGTVIICVVCYAEAKARHSILTSQ